LQVPFVTQFSSSFTMRNHRMTGSHLRIFLQTLHHIDVVWRKAKLDKLILNVGAMITLE